MASGRRTSVHRERACRALDGHYGELCVRVLSAPPISTCTHCAISVAASSFASAYVSRDWHDLHLDGSQFSSRLTAEMVWDAIVLYALIDDSLGRRDPLCLPHTGNQRDRFTAAMRARTECFILFGQPELPHYCDACMRVFPNGEKSMAILTDGISMGRPCCGIFRCKVSLANNRHRFCPDHASQHGVCGVLECLNSVKPGTRACELIEHQESYRLFKARGESLFQLKSRLLGIRSEVNNELVEVAVDALDEVSNLEDTFEAIGQDLHLTTHAGSSIGTLEPELLRQVPELVQIVPPPPPCPAKADNGNRTFKALFIRRRTHNEQLVIRPCGIIIARATFYGAEAISNVLVRLCVMLRLRL